MNPIHLIAGARPNFMKIAPIVRALRGRGVPYRIVHTGQHYDRDMNEVFFEELGIPQPDVFMGAGGGSHAEQTARIMVAYEKYVGENVPSLTLVVGDVNSTLACAIVAKKACIPVAHVEAGLRSGDMAMPEEINRLVTDSISDVYFATEPSGVHHLLREGKDKSAVHNVGHVMVDNLLYQVAQLDNADKAGLEGADLKAKLGRYGAVTMHRPSNVDDADVFRGIAGALKEISRDLPLVFPVHPRTRGNLEKFGIDLGPNVHLTKPLSYMAFLNVWRDAVLVMTDSGGLQEETTALGVPCITMRENTERPVTCDEGTNVLAGTDPVAILREARNVLSTGGRKGRVPDLWDGRAAERIVEVLLKMVG
ncbi:MAG: UDP-N-acetylglucosamine 2-epimerase (non-hydrolyzing) [Burkholderiales bacterium]